MKMKRSNAFASLLVATIALLATVNGRIYQTNDAIVFEIERTSDGSYFAKSFPFSQSDFIPIKNFLTGSIAPNPYIPFVEPAPGVTSYSTGLHPQQQGSNYYSSFHYSFAYQHPRVDPAMDFKSNQTAKQQSKQNIACGAGPDQNRIVSGTEAIPNSWPFMVGFMIPGIAVVFCGGSLISDTKILTAAHCFEQLSMYQLSLMVVKLGMHDRGDDEGVSDDAQMTRRISRMTLHKAYNTKTKYFDIAIVTMDSPVAFSAAISPVCLAPAIGKPDLYAGETATIMGWGDLFYDDASSQKLMEANAPIITNAECKQIYSNLGISIVNHMLCADSSTSDSCQGDSGGPLVVQSMEDGRWYQAGIVSFGKGCADPDFPAAVYTRVNWLRGWINGNMKN